jgi:DNA-binding NarL/FixJ family response regulator
MIRIVVADDHSVIRSGVSRWLDDDPEMEVVGQAKNGTEALELVRTLKPDVLISDIEMPDIKGTELIDEAQSIHSALKIVLMTMHKGWYVQKILDKPGIGYVTKEAEKEIFIIAIKWAMQGKCWIDPEELQEDIRRERIIHQASLTSTELSILELLELSNAEIAEHTGTKLTTIAKSHLPNIFYKIGVKNRYEALDWARKMKLVR